MISEAKIKKLENKSDKLDLTREKQERNARMMFPNDEKFYRFNGGLIPESYFERIIGKDKKP